MHTQQDLLSTIHQQHRAMIMQPAMQPANHALPWFAIITWLA
jgi:hypothetical protein